MRVSTPRSWLVAWWCRVAWLSLVISLPNSSVAQEQLTAEAIFNQHGVSGKIVFSDDGLHDSLTTILVNLTGLQYHGVDTFPWYVHQYPFPLDAKLDPCREAVTGDRYDPQAANSTTYPSRCGTDHSVCEVGDLSGRLGALNASSSVVEFADGFLSLRGIHTIIGRSVVLFANETRFVCANIDHPSSSSGVDLIYVPFHSNFTGNVYFRQHTNNSTASVYVDLSSIGELDNSVGHNWHVHQDPLDNAGTGCIITRSCYNPHNVDILSGMYTDLCNSTNQMKCAVGDLSNKGAPLDVMNRVVKQFYTDIDLTLSGEDTFVANRSLVIHEANGGSLRIACANISEFLPLEAEAIFSGPSSIAGSIRFTQLSPFVQTRVNMNLTGLGNIARDYHIHISPIGPLDLDPPDRCGDPYTGGLWNPLDVNNNEASMTSDRYAVGDLSSKFGSLANMSAVTWMFSDPNLPLFETFGIIGRSVVIHRNDAPGTPLACADIVHRRPIVTFSYVVNTSSIEGRIILIQLADDPYSSTTIIVTLRVKEALPLPSSTEQTPETTPFSSDISTSSISSFQTSTPVSTSISMGLIPGLESSPIPMPTSTRGVVPTPSASSSSGLEDEASSVSNLPSTSLAEQVSGSMTDTELSASMSLSSDFTDEQTLTFMSTEDLSATLSSLSMAELSTTLISSSRDFSTSESVADPILSLTSSPSMVARRMLRSLPQPTLLRRKRQTATSLLVPFAWSLRSGMRSANSVTCGDIVDSSPSNPDLCSRAMPLACSVGDLTAKHGTLNLPRDAGAMLRVVFTDSYLPLSGPLSPFSSASFSPLLMLQRSGGSVNEAICTGVLSVLLPTTPPSSLIGPIVGGVVAAVVTLIVVIIVLVLLVCVCMRRKSYDINGETKVEMGVCAPAKPVLGVPNYQVLHQYIPQNEGDLAMKSGDWVTLEETPYGGGWWRGCIDNQSGWFPKTYVKYVDREAEKKRKQEESFTLAAAAIMDASSSFSTHHPSISIKRRKSDIISEHLSTKKSKKAQRSHTFSRAEIDCTPLKVAKFDTAHLESAPTTEMVLENFTKDSCSTSDGGSRPNTPGSIANNVIIANLRLDDSEHSLSESETESLLSKATLEGGNLNVLHADKHAAKYDFVGTSNLELEFGKGDFVLVIEKANNGWWRGVHQGRVGWFPESYVNPMSLGKVNLVSNVEPDNGGKERGRQRIMGKVIDEVERPRSMDEMMAIEGSDLEASEYHALFSYQPETESELMFSAGDTVWVYWGQDNGWWFGATAGKQGWFPESYIEPIIESASAEETDTKMDLSDEEKERKGHEGNHHSPSNLLEAAVNSIDERSRFPSEKVAGGSSLDTGFEMDPSRKGEVEGALAKVTAEGKSVDNGDPLLAGLSVASTSLHCDIKDGSAVVNESALNDPAIPVKPTPLQDARAIEVLKPEHKVIKKVGQCPNTPSRRIPPPPPPPAGAIPTTDVPSTRLEEAVPVLSDTSQSHVLSSRKTDEAPLSKSVKKTSRINISDTKGTEPTRSQPADPELAKLKGQPTMSKGNFTKPRRRPPPPPIPTTSVAVTPSFSTDEPKPSEESIKAASTEMTANRTPIPAPRAKARVKKVKRPTSLPPPPSIPLPPPPPHSSSQPTTTAPSHPLSHSNRAPGTDQDAAIPKPTSCSNGASMSSDSKVNPIELRVGKIRRIQQDARKGSRPSPPTRISSLVQPPAPSLSAAKKSRKLEGFEEVTHGEAAEAGDISDVSADSRTFPLHPPPSDEDNTSATAASPSSRKYSNPPSSSPPALPTAIQPKDTSEAGHSIATRGSRLMSSLKKIVKRDSKKSVSHRKIELVALSPPNEGDIPVLKQSNENRTSPTNTTAYPTNLPSEGDTPVSKQSRTAPTNTPAGPPSEEDSPENRTSPTNTPAAPPSEGDSPENRTSPTNTPAAPPSDEDTPENRTSPTNTPAVPPSDEDTPENRTSPTNTPAVPPSDEDTPVSKQSNENRTSTITPASPTNHFYKKAMDDVTALRQQPPERPSQPPNTFPQQTPNAVASRRQPPERPSQPPNTLPQQTPKVAASRQLPEKQSQPPNISPEQTPSVASSEQQPPERPSQPPNTSPQQTPNVAASRQQPPERPFQPPDTSPQQKPSKSLVVAPPKVAQVNQLVDELDEPSSASTSNPLLPQLGETSVTKNSKDTSSPSLLKKSMIPEKPPPPITATSVTALTGNSKDTSSNSLKKRASIPEKPPPPVAANSKAVQKPASPVVPTPSPKPDTAAVAFKMPNTSKPSTNNSKDTNDNSKDTNGSSHLTTESKLQGQINNNTDSLLESPAKFYRATNAYEAQSDDELSFAEGDTLMFIDKRDNGFYYGMKDDGLTGLFPICIVEPFFRK